MDYLAFFVIVVTIMVAVIAVLTVHHAYKVREMKLDKEQAEELNHQDWENAGKALKKMMKDFPKIMKEFALNFLFWQLLHGR